MATVLDTAAQERWEKEVAAAPTRDQPPTTVSSVPIEPLYTPDSLNGFDPDVDLGYPGQYPFTRGVHATMYRSRLWTMRQFAGFGTPRQTNERFRFLLEKGQTASAPRSICRHSWASTATIPAPSAKSAG